MIVGIDASNLQRGGGVTHIVEILSNVSIYKHNVSKVIIWGSEYTLSQIDNYPWLKKVTPKELNLPYQNKVQNLLNLVKDIDILPMKNDEECCGFGGTFFINENELSVKMAKDKLKNFSKTNANFFVGYDCSCMMHLKSVSDFEKKDIKYLHIVEILAGLRKGNF
jgi:heterodisulfide reductase subunit B